MADKKTWNEFLAEFDECIHHILVQQRQKPGVTGIACLVCHVMDSSKLGRKTAVIYGPGCTFQTLAQIEDLKGGVYVDGLPSSASFAESYTEEIPT